MTYLAFDPWLLAAARHRAAAIPEGLARLRSADPLAADANRALSVLIEQLQDQWIPLIDRVLACTALTATEQRVLAPTDLQRVILAEALSRGWRLVGDPLAATGGGPVLSIEQVRTLAGVLAEDAEHRSSGDEHDRHLTDEDAEIAWLAEAMDSIGADADLTAAFNETFTAWPAFAGWISARWVQLIGAAKEEPGNHYWRERGDDLDRLLRGIATVIRAASPGDGPPQRLAELTPYAAALLTARMELDPEVRARFSAELINRYWNGGGSARPAVDVERIGDVLLPAVLAIPSSATTLLEVVHPDALYFAALDTSLTHRVLVAGTEPPMRIHRVSALLTTFLDDAARTHEYALPPGADFEVQAALAAMALPWLGWIAARYESLGWTEAERDRRLEVVLSTERARQVILGGQGTWVTTLADDDLVQPDGRRNPIVLDDVATALSLILDRVRRGEISEASQSVFIGDVIEKLAGHLPDLISMKRPGAEKLAKEMVGRAVDSAVAWARRNGVLPPTKDQVDERSAAAWRRRSLDGKVYVIVLALSLMEHRGSLPKGFVERIDLGDPDGCEAAAIQRRLAGLALDPGLTHEQSVDVHDVVSTLINPGEASLLCR